MGGTGRGRVLPRRIAGFHPMVRGSDTAYISNNKPDARIKKKQAMPETGKLHMEKLSKTIKIPIMDIEKKTIPVICSWCGRVTSLMEWDVECGKRIAPTHGICQRCLEIASPDCLQ